MRLLTCSVVGLSLSPSVACHYLFGRLIVNETITPTWMYVRESGPLGGTTRDLTNPQFDFTVPDLRCGRNGTITGNITKTATVVAGTEVGFQVGDIVGVPGLDPATMYHPGVGSMFLSKVPKGQTFSRTLAMETVPDRLATNTGSQWTLMDAANWNVTLPQTTPPGKYLLRMEHIFPLNSIKDSADGPWVTRTQFYVNCAQIEVVGDGGGVPRPLVKIPGIYNINMTNVFFNVFDPEFDVTKYVAPAPSVWSG